MQCMSNYTSTLPPPNAATTNMATFTSALLASASRTGNTTVVQNSNNCRTTSPFQRNSPFATGILTTTSTTSHPFNFPHMTLTTRPGFKNITSFPTGCRHSTGLSYPTTSSSKLKVGSSPNTVLTFTPVWPPTSDFSASSADGNMPSTNHISSPPLDCTLSHSSAISPNTRGHLSKQPSNCAAANTLTWRSTPSDEWHQTWRSLDGVEHSISSTKPSSTATSAHPSPTSPSPYLS